MRSALTLSMVLLVVGAATPAFAQAKKPTTQVWTDLADKALPTDFKVQGECQGATADKQPLGCQGIALGGGALQAVLFPGGLPGDGWDGKQKILLAGKLDGDRATFKAAEGERKYLAQSPEEFSATST